MTGVSAYVLAGGKSTRFGSDKARATFGEVPMIGRVADALRPCCREVVAVADVVDKYADLGLRTIADHRPGLGPLAGVEAALADRLNRHGDGWVLLASCDLVGLKTIWAESLTDAISSAASHADRAYAFRGEFWQPFPGAYHTGLLPAVSRLLDEGRGSFQRLLSETGPAAIPLRLPNDWPAIVQANTPEELERFRHGRG